MVENFIWMAILSNKNNSIICTFQKNKQGYTTTSYIKINDDLDDIIDKEILSELFTELEKYLF